MEDGGQVASKRRRQGDSVAEKLDVVDDEYFRSYDDLSIHALMLGDAPRVGAYLAAIRTLRGRIEGRVVLDVGAGSGVLSLLMARHGAAARVYAAEAAPGMAALARELVSRNNLDEVVKVLEGRVEDLKLPEQVDVIVSEWMGFYLVHESMLESVLVSRDRWLKPGGLMMPSSARIWAAPVDAESLRQEIETYGCLHGLDLAPVGEAELARRCREPQVELVEPARLLASPVLAADLGDLGVLKSGATREFVADVAFVVLRAGRAAGVALWFDTGFGAAGGAKDVVLCTSPGAPPTHWKQTVVYLGVFAPVEAGDELSARLTFRQSAENPRQYDISVET